MSLQCVQMCQMFLRRVGRWACDSNGGQGCAEPRPQVSKALVLGWRDGSLLLGWKEGSLVLGWNDGSLVLGWRDGSLVLGWKEGSLVLGWNDGSLVLGWKDGSLVLGWKDRSLLLAPHCAPLPWRVLAHGCPAGWMLLVQTGECWEQHQLLLPPDPQNLGELGLFSLE